MPIPFFCLQNSFSHNSIYINGLCVKMFLAQFYDFTFYLIKPLFLTINVTFETKIVSRMTKNGGTNTKIRNING